MKLTNQHIQDLYKFTHQHYVVYYDVQTELVDHLANNIEQIWQEKPNITFEEARDTSFKKFGVFGFMDVLEKKHKAMSKKYAKILWRFAKEWFRLPKIIITLGGVVFLYTLFSSQFGYFIFYGLQALFIVYIIIKGLKLQREFKKREKKSNKKWMLESMIFQSAYAGTFAYVANSLQVLRAGDSLQTSWVAFLFALVFVIAFLVAYITLEVIPEKGEELLAETYPEYKLANSL